MDLFREGSCNPAIRQSGNPLCRWRWKPAGQAVGQLYPAFQIASRTNIDNGANGDTGWGGAWTGASAATVVDPVADLQGKRSPGLTATVQNMVSRQLASAFTGGSLSVSFFQQTLRGTVVGNNDSPGLWLDNGSGATDKADRPNIGAKI